MTPMQKLNALKTLSGESKEEILSVYLDLAGARILEKCYPFRSDKTEVPEKYHSLQIEIAVYLLNKRGAEGQLSHSENGISRAYESASIPDSMLKGVIPFAAVFSGGSG